MVLKATIYPNLLVVLRDCIQLNYLLDLRENSIQGKAL